MDALRWNRWGCLLGVVILALLSNGIILRGAPRLLVFAAGFILACLLPGYLLTRIALPGDTLVYCAHEYTVANLLFAREVEPFNKTLEKRLEDAQGARDKGRPTVPSTISEELETNPFLRCDQSAVTAAAEKISGLDVPTAVDVFTIIRSWKDGWRG